MVDVTLFEVHLDDTELTANAPFSRGEKDVTAGEGSPEDEESSSKASLLGAVVGLAFVVAVAYLARKRLVGDADEQFELADVTA